MSQENTKINTTQSRAFAGTFSHDEMTLPPHRPPPPLRCDSNILKGEKNIWKVATVELNLRWLRAAKNNIYINKYGAQAMLAVRVVGNAERNKENGKT